MAISPPRSGAGFGWQAASLAARRAVNRWNVTVLLVEHDMQVVFAICDRLTVLHLGRFLSEGSCAEIRDDPTVVAAYLGTQA